MKLVTFQIRQNPADPPRLGIVVEMFRSEHGLLPHPSPMMPRRTVIVDLAKAAEIEHATHVSAQASQQGRGGERKSQATQFADMLAWLEAGPPACDAAQRLVEFVQAHQPDGATCDPADCRLLAPLPRPRSIRDCMAFEQHLIQCTRTVVSWRLPMIAPLDRWWQRATGRSFLRPPRVWYERPIYYKGNPNSVVGPDANIVWPSYTTRLDYELEFAAVIGREGRDIAVADASSHIAGYMIFNDYSARDIQLREMKGRLGPAKGKDFDTGNAFGPWLVTPDEVGDPHALQMTARVNGEVWSRGSSSEMRFTFAELISYISQSETLVPGDVIGSGTVPSGCGLELDRWLQPGDIVELEVDRLGALRNRIVRPEQKQPHG